MVPLFRFMSTSVPLCAWHQKIEHHDPCVLKHPAYQMPNLQPSRIAPSRRVEVLTNFSFRRSKILGRVTRQDSSCMVSCADCWHSRPQRPRLEAAGNIASSALGDSLQCSSHLTGCAHRPAGLQMGALLQHKQRNYVRSLALAPSSDRGVSAGHL